MTITLEQIIYTLLCGAAGIILNQFRVRINRIEEDVKKNEEKSDKIVNNYITRFDELKAITNSNHIEVIQNINQVERNLNEKLLSWKEK